MNDVFRILVICSGNRCRSPFAESYLSRALAGLPVEVSSAGTLDIGPADVPTEMATIATSLGLDLSEHRARSLVSIKGTAVDLVLGMERNHVAAAVVDGGMPADKTFSLAELVRLLDPPPTVASPDPAIRARTTVAEAAARRSRDRMFVADEDVPDPFGRSKKTYKQVATRVADLCAEVVWALFGIASTPVA
ncbi:MAG: hypothetical protein ABR579_09210 [Actinomycetota bacterium]